MRLAEATQPVGGGPGAERRRPGPRDALVASARARLPAPAQEAASSLLWLWQKSRTQGT